MKKGKVYLVGAGPGDPGLFTLKGKKVLEEADVIIYDYLANVKLLNFCKENVEKIYVGKKGGAHTLPQEKINKLLVKKAKEGKTVVRLKGGDPFLFGRGGEEAEELQKEGIPFEIIPGITSAIAVPAYAGIPVTHRNFTSTLAIITGHEAEGKEESKINFSALSKIGTLVFLMGVKNLPYIIENLIKEGKSPETPVAVIQWGTLPKQKTVTGVLKNIVEKVKKTGVTAPAIIIVGEVVRLREKFNWFETKLLFGKKVVVTRTREQASKLVENLEALGAYCYEIPAIKIEPLLNENILEVIKKISNYKWIIFTSENGVKIFFKILWEAGKDWRAFGNTKIAVIGASTKKALEKLGIKPDLVPAKDFTQEGLINEFAKLDIKNNLILIPRAKEARELLPEKLKEMGAKVEILPIYETKICEESKKELKKALEEGVDIITFTSSSTVKNFFKLCEDLDKEKLKDLIFASIGPITSSTLRDFGFEPHIEAKEYTIEGLVNAIAEYFKIRGTA
ncbi:uroporphyrinogen-III C-methyltransferase [Thermodesulfobacterium hydrogeniphilum]|uniref:uroporphyrinogen-III C-methyltransferase n=1 Tax=Thermodesulfobacterium hydrogeniphilum TaxID=161156 RepID=UPI0005703C7B|nr:uroporphyrinogen-III C-methyltransferase [Thermodesulfobacterium hydrogeniphilum]